MEAPWLESLTVHRTIWDQGKVWVYCPHPRKGGDHRHHHPRFHYIADRDLTCPFCSARLMRSKATHIGAGEVQWNV